MALSDSMILIVSGSIALMGASVVVVDGIYRVCAWIDSNADKQFTREQLAVVDQARPQMRNVLSEKLIALLRPFISSDQEKALIALLRRFDPRRRARKHQFAQQLPDALDQIAQALGAGLSLPQAVERAANYLGDPMGSELHKVHSHMSISHSFDQSFMLLRDEFDCRELELVCSGIGVQSRLGGNMKEMLQRIARYCRQSQSLERSLKAQTAQSRLSLKIILFAPFILCAVLSILMPSFITNLLFTPPGRIMTTVALVLDGIGIVWARAIMRVGSQHG